MIKNNSMNNPLLVTIRRFDPVTRRDLRSTAILRGSHIVEESEGVYDATDAAIMRGVDARYRFDRLPRAHESCEQWIVRRYHITPKQARDIRLGKIRL